jgi:hypothetical protein
MIREAIEKLRGYAFTKEESNEVIRVSDPKKFDENEEVNITLNKRKFPSFTEVVTLIGNQKKLLSYVSYMYEKYNEVYDIVGDLSPEYVKYLRGIDEVLDSFYSKQLSSSSTYEESLYTKLELFRKESNDVKEKLIKYSVKKNLERAIRNLQEIVGEI